MLTPKYIKTKIYRQQTWHYSPVNLTLLSTMLLYSLVDVANAVPLQFSISPINGLNEQLITDDPITQKDSELTFSAITINPPPEFSPLITTQSKIAQKRLDNSNTDSPSQDSISLLPLAILKQGSAPPTLAEWKATVSSTTARGLLPQSSFPLERETTLYEPQNVLAQAPPKNPALQPAPSPISPELQRLQQEFLLKEPETLTVTTRAYVAAPGASITTPIAFGAAFGQIFGGFGFQSRTRYTDSADGAIALGIGLGDAEKVVGLDVTTAVLSLFGDDSFGRGGISLKVHRLLPEDMAIAVGAENAIVWGSTDAGSAIYGVFSKFFQLKETSQEPFSQLTLTVGLGGGRFRSEGDINNGVGSIGVFGSIGLRVIEPMSLIAEWSGQDLNLGVSLSPIRDIPLTVNLAGADITGNAGDGARFILSIGYNYLFPR